MPSLTIHLCYSVVSYSAVDPSFKAHVAAIEHAGPDFNGQQIAHRVSKIDHIDHIDNIGQRESVKMEFVPGSRNGR